MWRIADRFFVHHKIFDEEKTEYRESSAICGLSKRVLNGGNFEKVRAEMSRCRGG